MKISKIRNVKTPNRGTEKSAGIDFFIPDYDEKFKEDFLNKNPNIIINEEGILLYPHQRVNIPSGIKCNIPSGYALIAYNKSGISLKYGLDVGASVIDEDYQGELHLSLVNTSNEEIKINYGQKIIQFILLPVFYDIIEEIEENLLFEEKTERGNGGFGSTGV